MGKIEAHGKQKEPFVPKAPDYVPEKLVGVYTAQTHEQMRMALDKLALVKIVIEMSGQIRKKLVFERESDGVWCKATWTDEAGHQREGRLRPKEYGFLCYHIEESGLLSADYIADRLALDSTTIRLEFWLKDGRQKSYVFARDWAPEKVWSIGLMLEGLQARVRWQETNPTAKKLQDKQEDGTTNGRVME